MSLKFAERAVLNRIDKMTFIAKVTLPVALKDGETAQEFTLSRTWTPPRTVFQLDAGPFDFVNITYLVTDADLTVKGLLIGFPMLQHLCVDTKTLLEQ